MNDYFTFYVKHFELPLCMKCAIQINLPCLALPCLGITYIIKYNTIFEEKKGFPANLELVFTLCWILGSNNKNIHEHMITYNMYSEMLFLNIVRNCTHLFVKQTNKKKLLFLWPLLKIQRSLLRRLNPSTYSAITYWHAIQGYINYYLDM